MSQQIDRLIVSRGPAMVSFNGGFFFSKDDITVDLSKDTKPIPSSAFGPLTEINQGIKASAKFTPVGEFEHLGVLWPYASTPVGKSIFGDADVPLLIQPLDTTQKQTRFKAAALSKMPDLNFTATDTLLGDVEFQMVGANNTAVDDANRLFLQENNTLDLDTLPYDPDALIIQAYQNSWLSAGTWHPAYNGDDTTAAIAFDAAAAAVQTALRTITALSAATVTGDYLNGFTVADAGGLTPNLFTAILAGMPGGMALRADAIDANTVQLRLFPWANFVGREGVKVAFSLTLTEDTSDAIGHYDTIFSGLSVTASATPQGVDDLAALLAADVQGANAVRGKKLQSAHNLDISGEGVFFRLYGSGLKKSGLVYSSSKQRVPEMQWVASRTIGLGGALNPLFFIGTEEPA